MCNLYTQTKSVDEIARVFRDLQMPLTFPDGVPNLAGDTCITDRAPIVRAVADAPGTYELVVRRWSWPGGGGKPVYNFRSDNREFSADRVIIPASGFYEFTASPDPKQKRKDRWLFTAADGAPLGIAGIVRASPEVGEAFTLLTTTPGADVAPYHNRQVALLRPDQWRAWLDHQAPAAELLGPSPPGSLVVRPAPR
ncbi:MAG: SOS response-associated peptidase [Sphingomonas sp.]